MKLITKRKPIFKTKCPICSTRRKYNEAHDAYYCPKCSIWLEPKCGHKGCEFCALRPERLGEDGKKISSKIRLVKK